MASSLAIEGVHAGYGAVRVIEDVSLDVGAGRDRGAARHQRQRQEHADEMHHGHGAAERRAASSPRSTACSHDLTGRTTEEIVDLGIALVPEGRRLFPKLTVEENLLLGAFRRPRARRSSAISTACFETFPRLAERRSQLAGCMSGGEQQMLALGRALMLAPKILLVDEPSVGLAPILVSRTIDAIKELKEQLQPHRADGRAELHPGASASPTAATSSCTARSRSRARSADELNNNDLIRKFYLGL